MQRIPCAEAFSLAVTQAPGLHMRLTLVDCCRAGALRACGEAAVRKLLTWASAASGEPWSLFRDLTYGDDRS